MNNRPQDYVTREDEREWTRGPRLNGYMVLALVAFCAAFWLGLGYLFGRLL